MRTCLQPKPTFAALLLTTASAALAAPAAERLSEDFSNPPQKSGWIRFGDTELSRWDSVGQQLEFTWDSSRPNSGIAHRLPRVMTEKDDLAFAFDLELLSHEVGVDPARPSTFQIAAGLVRLDAVRSLDYVRGALPGPRDTLEWTWFGAKDPIAASISPTVIPSDGRLPWGYADSFVTLEVGTRYRFDVQYTASDRTLRLRMKIGSESGPSLDSIVLPPEFTGFSVDAFAICSYSAQGQHPLFGGSVLARAVVDNVLITVPAPPVELVRIDGKQVSFRASKGWRYRLEASGDLQDWSAVDTVEPTEDGVVRMSDLRDAVFREQFYRVRAVRP
jgi:hypothetical protein